MIKISGVYRDPAGVAMPGALIAVKSKNNTLETFKCLCVETVTGLGGEYEFSVAPDDYEVFVTYNNGIRQRLGFMRIEDGAADGSLNDYLIYADPELARPPVYSDIKRMSERARNAEIESSESARASAGYRDAAMDARDVAVAESKTAKESAQSAIASEKGATGSAASAANSAKESKTAEGMSKKYSDDARDYSEITQSVSDAYSDEIAAQKAVDDGKETRKYFWVHSQSTNELALEYTVSNGRIVPTGRWSMAGAAVTDALNEMKTRVSTVPNAPAGIADNIAAGVEFADGHFAPLMLDDGRHAFIDANGMLRVVAADSDVVVRPYIEAQPYTLPDGAVCTKIIVDPYENITEAWTEDGGYYFATPDGLKRVGDLKPAAQQIKQATAVSDLVMNYGATRISVSDDLRPVMYILPTFGQSLAEGWSTYDDDVLIATTQLYPENAWMFKSDRGAGKENPNRGPNPIDEIVSLKDTVNGNWKETSCSSSASHIISEVEKMTGKRIHILRYVAAQGSMAYRNLTKGTYAWSVLIQGLIDAKRICERMGFKPIVLGVDVKAGESDIDKTGGIYADLYTRFLMNFDRNINAEVKRIFGGDHPAVSIFVEQCSWWPFTEWDIKNVRQGQLSADGHGNIRFTGPGYQYPHVGDIIHINSKGQNQRGVSLARAVVFECFGTGFIPVKPMEVYWSGANTIDIICSSSVEIIKDTSDVIVSSIALGPGAGFGIRARDSSPISITSATPFGKIGIRLNVDNPTNTRNVQISYAQRRTGSDNQSGPIYGARGLFRTKDGITNLYTGEIEYQWLPAFIWELN
ncbi:prophage tail fiber N-terminal domain-containing protein [Serratia ureilytica]|uniref:prophage tail fiber N-terminal domain-containing protein n=1 Tax=Serratia ureilytica TaxID=300181 RepID=UPI0019D0953E|nr:prophage tail fiber N-terminal domain-containing protein [Serratia ureilytica]MBN5214056.1 prophage tail fiber N-terminal domain-containing protein [Serratia ureilytica]